MRGPPIFFPPGTIVAAMPVQENITLHAQRTLPTFETTAGPQQAAQSCSQHKRKHFPECYQYCEIQGGREGPHGNYVGSQHSFEFD